MFERLFSSSLFLNVLKPRVVALDRVISVGKIELVDISTECKQMTYAKSNYLK